MAKYILKRTLLLIPTLLLVTTIVFCLMRLVPGSAAHVILQDRGEAITEENVEALEDEMGLNDPLIVQYLRYMKDIFTGNWGDSYYTHTPVFQNILDVWEPTLLITIYSTLITVILAIPLGILAATHRNSILDFFVSASSMVAMVIPVFCLGLLMNYWFGFKLDIFPTVSYVPIADGGLWNSLYYLTIPSIVLGMSHVGSLVRYTRSTMLDVLGQDYIRTARAKGLSRTKVYYKHALKNTMSIVATLIANSIVSMLGGATITETVFNIRGMGTLALISLNRRDYQQEQAIVLLMAFIFLGVALLMDVFYKVLDPRIEYE